MKAKACDLRFCDWCDNANGYCGDEVCQHCDGTGKIIYANGKFYAGTPEGFSEVLND